MPLCEGAGSGAVVKETEMDMNTLAPPAPPSAGHIETEQEVREDLAAAYRLIAHFGMTDTVYTHLSVRLPGAVLLAGVVWVRGAGGRGRC